MIQTPAPDPVIIQVPEVPPVIIEPSQLPPEIIYGGGAGDWIPIAGMLTGVAITAMFLLGPIGRAIGGAIKHWLGGGHRQELPSEDIDELHARIDGLTRQVAELAERQDFTDRMLAQVRKERALPGSTDVAG